MKEKDPRILIDSSSPKERRSFLKKLGGIVAGTAALGGFTNLFARKTYSGTELSTYASPEPFIGSISMVGFNFAPRDWALCWGGLVQITDYTALYSLIGTYFGGDGRVSMGLPDLRGRVPVGYGSGQGLTPKQIGQMYGFETHQLTLSQMPVHNHTASYESPTYSASGSVKPGAKTGPGPKVADPTGAYLANSGTNLFSTATPNAEMGETPVDVALTETSAGAVVINNAGSGSAFNIMQPWTCVNFIIALDGIYPPRN